MCLLLPAKILSSPPMAWLTQSLAHSLTHSSTCTCTSTHPDLNSRKRCAFFGHCDHKIATVQEGHRLTLTYILRYDPADKGIADQMKEGMGAGAPLPLPPAGGEG